MDWLSMGIGVAGGIYGLFSGNKASAQAQDYSQANAYNVLMATYYNNAQALNMAQFSSQLSQVAVSASNDITRAVAEYNSYVTLLASEKNVELLEREADYVYQEADLNIFQREQQAERTVGTMTTAYGASGAQLNVPGDAPQAAIINAKTQANLDTFIIRHGADIQAGKLLDAAATSEWEGRNAANAIMFNWYAESLSRSGSAMLQSQGLLAQTKVNNAANLYNAGIDVSNIISQGSYEANQYSRAGTQALFSGLFSAAGAAARSYTPSSTYSPTALYNETPSVSSGSGSYAWSTGYSTKY